MKKKTFHFCGKALAVSLTALAAVFSFASCSDDDDEKEKEEIIPTEVYDFHFYVSDKVAERAMAAGGIKDDTDIILDMDYIGQLANEPKTKKINFVATGDFRILDPEGLSMWSKTLTKRRNLEPTKIGGSGVINTEPGVASQVPADSTALANMGFIVGYHADRNN